MSWTNAIDPDTIANDEAVRVQGQDVSSCFDGRGYGRRISLLHGNGVFVCTMLRLFVVVSQAGEGEAKAMLNDISC